MRKKVLILVLLLSQLRLLAQSDYVRLSLTNASLQAFLEEVCRQTGYRYHFTGNTLSAGHPVSIVVSYAHISNVLPIAFEGQPYLYAVRDRVIYVWDKPSLPVSQKPPPGTVKGKVMDDNGYPVDGATVRLRSSGKSTTTNSSGEFELTDAQERDTLEITHVSFSPEVISLRNRQIINVKLMAVSSSLSPVEVSAVSTGYQKLPMMKMTGSVTLLDSMVLNRRISTNIIDRLENLSSGLLFNREQISGSKARKEMFIRGISTIFGDKNPLIVIDNFPYDGDLSNINPNDIDSVTILKDASASGIYGAFAGNGVIIMTTKKGEFEQPAKVSLISNVTVSNRPNLFYSPFLSATDYMDINEHLYNRGYFNTALAQPYGFVPEDILIRDQMAKGLISQEEGNAQLAALRRSDSRYQQSDYFYRRGINQQYALNISGGSSTMRYFLSGGYDRNESNLKKDYYERITVNAHNHYQLVKDKLDLTAAIAFTQSTASNNDLGNTTLLRPYSQLVDENGNPAILPIELRQQYKDTAGGGLLLPWYFKPLEEMNMVDDITRLTDYRVNFGINLKIINHLTASIKYQFGRGESKQENYMSEDTYFSRDLINRYSQINWQTQMVTRPIPKGGIMDATEYEYSSHNVRLQLDYNRKWKQGHEINATAGVERRSVETQLERSRKYGYDKATQTFATVNYEAFYPLYHLPFAPSNIPNFDYKLGTTDNFRSYFANVVYSYKSRYHFSVNGRKDESNLFGAQSNSRFAPLWSVGAAWDLSREKFYSSRWLNSLKLKITYGHTGNIDKTISPYTTVTMQGNNNYGVLRGFVANPANEALQWEKVRITNYAVEFSAIRNHLWGTVEFYTKNSTDLTGIRPIDHTTGVASVKANIADMKGKGFDITLNSTFLRRRHWQWYGHFIYSYVSNRVTRYLDSGKTAQTYITEFATNPITGRPLQAIYAYRWAGLNPLNGNPKGIYGGHESEEYGMIKNSTNLQDFVYVGSATPKIFGSYRNTISYKQFQFSFLVQYKFAYYFRRPSIHYSSILSGFSFGHPDYLNRWKNPGDEYFTTVPSMPDVLSTNRDDFYQYSEVLTAKADHIRLQDLQFSYNMNRNALRHLPFQSITWSLYLNNIGLLWKSTRADIDPEYIKDNYRDPLTITVGMKVNL